MQNSTGTKKLLNEKDSNFFFMLCWLTYFCTYLGRLNFTASLGVIVETGSYTRVQMGLVGSGFFIGYGIFQLVFGILGDKLNPRLLVFFGIGGSGLLNLAMGFADSATTMTVLWTLNGIVQSAVWSPMLRLTVERLLPAQSYRASVNYSTTVPLGTFAAYLLSAGAVALSGWRSPFFVSGILLCSMSLWWLFGIGRLEKKAELFIEKEQRSTITENKKSLPHAILAMLGLVAAAALLNGLLRDGIQTWMPSFLRENYGLSPSVSIVFTLVIPVVNLGGVYIGKWMNDRLFRSEAVTSAAAFFAAAMLLALFGALTHAPLWLCLALFALSTAMMLAVNIMLVTLVPLRLAKSGHVSTLSGVLNSATYAGSTLSGYGVGLLLQTGGWSVTIWAWSAAALVGTGICLVLIRPWRTAAQAADDK